MSCPVCDSCPAVPQESPPNAQRVVKCDNFGEIKFTRTAYAVLRSVDKKRLQDYCRNSYDGTPITYVIMMTL